MKRLLLSILLVLTSWHGLAQNLKPAQVLILIGPPGSGKSVQAKQLTRALGIPAISAETLVQNEMGKKTPLAQALAPAIASGELLDDASMNALFHSRLLRADAGRGFILDGYPMTTGQAETLDAFLKEQDFPPPTVLFIDVPEEILRERMQNRRRADDQPANIDRRLHEYRDQGALLTKWYGEQRLLRVDGDSTPTVVSGRIAKKIEEAGLRKGFATRPKELKQRPSVTP